MKNYIIILLSFCFFWTANAQMPIVQVSNQQTIPSNNLVQRLNFVSQYKIDSLNCYVKVGDDVYGMNNQYIIQHDWYHNKLFIYCINKETQKNVFSDVFELNSGYLWLSKENEYVFQSKDSEIHLKYKNNGEMEYMLLYSQNMKNLYKFY